MSNELPRPTIDGPWRMDVEAGVIRDEHGGNVLDEGDNWDAVAALPDWIALADRQAGLLEKVRSFAAGKAITAHARGLSDQERYWLDLLALLERGGVP